MKRETISLIISGITDLPLQTHSLNELAVRQDLNKIERLFVVQELEFTINTSFIRVLFVQIMNPVGNFNSLSFIPTLKLQI